VWTTKVRVLAAIGAVGLAPASSGAQSTTAAPGLLSGAGDPVDPETVAAVRAQTATRTTPWTDSELLAMIPGGRRGQ